MVFVFWLWEMLLWLIIAEHPLTNVAFHNQTGDTYPKWSATTIRTWLNSTAASQFLNGKTTLQGAAQSKTLYTRIVGYGAGPINNYTGNPSLYETTEDKIFLLGSEETYYTGTDNAPVPNNGGGTGRATTDIAEIRTNGSKVLFADQNARKATPLSGVATWHWVRTPATTSANGGTVTNNDGSGLYNTYITPLSTGFGTRPAAWVVQQ